MCLLECVKLETEFILVIAKDWSSEKGLLQKERNRGGHFGIVQVLYIMTS